MLRNMDVIIVIHICYLCQEVEKKISCEFKDLLGAEFVNTLIIFDTVMVIKIYWPLIFYYSSSVVISYEM